MSIPVWQIPPVDIAKAVEAVRIVRLGERMLDEQAHLNAQLNVALVEYTNASERLRKTRKRRYHDDYMKVSHANEIEACERHVCRELDDLWIAQENIKRWEAWFG